jgi:nucleoside phosphorylase
MIVAPTTLEISAVRKGLVRFLEGNYRLLMCGVGEGQSSAFCEKLNPAEISRLVLVGWGGGLTNVLKAGDIVCADAALYSGRPAIPCAIAPSSLRSGPILTAPHALMTPAEKQVAASSGALAVEMEAYPLAAWASQHSIPFLHGRVILDAWNEALPNVETDDTGQVRPFKLLKKLVKHPAIVTDLARLGRRVQILNPLLAKLAIDLISG